ncbi:MAG: sugar-binding transcriptional regulator [Anaerolineales bacterium]
MAERAPNNLPDDEYRLCVRVAKLYHEGGLTQREIGGKLGLSRTKVHRILQTAKEHGIVQIQIITPDTEYFDLEHDLITHYQLRDAIVVPSYPPGQDLYLSLVKGAVSWLEPKLEDDLRIGLGLGRTISHLPQAFNPNGQIDCTFTEVVGAASDHNSDIAAYNITSKMAEIVGGKAEFFYAPTYVSSPSLKNNLIQEPAIKKSLARARNSDIVLQSVGPVDKSALLYLHGLLDEEDLQNLRSKGAVGDALGHYFGEMGHPVPFFTDQLMIGLELSDLTEIPWSVVIAGGKPKIPVLDAALKGKFFNVVVTDVDTAKELIKES